MPSTTSYLLIGLVAAVATFVFTPIVGWVARHLGWVAQPDERRIHTVATPDVGGIAMFMGFVAALVARAEQPFDTIFRATTSRAACFRGVVDVHGRLFDDVRDIPRRQGDGHDRRCRVLTYYGVRCSTSACRSSMSTRSAMTGRADHCRVVVGHDSGDQPHDGWTVAAGIVAIGALAFFIYRLRLVTECAPALVADDRPMIAIITVGSVSFSSAQLHPRRSSGDGLPCCSVAVGGQHQRRRGQGDPTCRDTGADVILPGPLLSPCSSSGPHPRHLFAIIAAPPDAGCRDGRHAHLHHRLSRWDTPGARRDLWSWTALLSAFVLSRCDAEFRVMCRSAQQCGLLLYTLSTPKSDETGRPERIVSVWFGDFRYVG